METERLVLRRWEEADAEALYHQANDPRVGPAAGWPVHESVDHSRDVIRTVFSAPEVYAVVPKTCGEPAGCVGLMVGDDSTLLLPADECEIGYWLGVTFWGQGLATEACRRLLRHAFDDMGMSAVWCRYYDGNERSRRVAEKCGLRHVETLHNVHCELIGDTRTEHVTRLSAVEWHEQNKKQKK